MERIEALLKQIISISKIHGYEDIELSATIFLGSVEKDCVDEFSQSCERFTKTKVEEIIFIQQIQKMINEN